MGALYADDEKNYDRIIFHFIVLQYKHLLYSIYLMKESI
jgi:hypothetical protein